MHRSVVFEHGSPANRVGLYFVALALLIPKDGLIDYSILALVIVCLFQRRSGLFVIPITTEIIFIYAGLFSLFLLGFFSLLVNDVVSDNIFLRPIRNAILLWVFSAYFYKSDKSNFLSALYICYYAALINGVVIITQYMLHLRGMSVDFLLIPGFDEGVNVAYRKPGLASGYPIAGLLTLMGLFSLFMIHRLSAAKINRAAVAVLVLSLFLASRTSLYLSFVLLFGYLFYSLLLLRIRVLNTIVIYSAILFVVILFLVNYEIAHHDTINVMFELFINAKEGDISTASSDALMQSWRFDTVNIGTIFYGNGLPNKNDALDTLDDGYQINLFGGGAFYFAMTYFLFFVILFKLHRYSMRQMGYIFVIVGVVYLIFEAKCAVIFSRIVTDLLIVLYAGAVFSGKRCAQ